MNLLKLKQFIKVCETGNLTKAAAELFISQSALSQSISQLEDELGHRLFDRRSKALVLNVQGEIVLRYARQIVKLSEEMAEAIRYSQTSHNLFIATHDSAFCSYLVAQFLLENPTYNISTTALRKSGLEQLERQEVDLLISAHAIKREGIVSRHLFSDVGIVVVPRNSPHYGMGSAHMADFSGELFYRNSLLLHGDAEYSNANLVTDFLHKNKIYLDIAYLPYASLKLLLLGDRAPRNFFMTSLSCFLEPELCDIDPKRMIRLDDPELSGEFWLSHPKKCRTDTQTFLDWLRSSPDLLPINPTVLGEVTL